jgi:prepilin-type N-terminal cleavage/methylation domain-containing protein
METRKGFTLIELLVVIAIIGILSSIVLVGMSGATKRAKDARIISDMDQIRSTAMIFHGNNGTYTGLDGYGDEDSLASDIATQGGTYTIYIDSTAGDDYCATAKLNSGHCWCVDSSLRSKDYGDAGANDCDTVATACASTCEAADSCACE